MVLPLEWHTSSLAESITRPEAHRGQPAASRAGLQQYQRKRAKRDSNGSGTFNDNKLNAHFSTETGKARVGSWSWRQQEKTAWWAAPVSRVGPLAHIRPSITQPTQPTRQPPGHHGGRYAPRYPLRRRTRRTRGTQGRTGMPLLAAPSPPARGGSRNLTESTGADVVYRAWSAPSIPLSQDIPPAAARSRPLARLAAPCPFESVEVEMVAAFPLIRGRGVFIRSPRGSGAAAAATFGGAVTYALGSF